MGDDDVVGGRVGDGGGHGGGGGGHGGGAIEVGCFPYLYSTTYITCSACDF
jgi:hypothetical protein